MNTPVPTWRELGQRIALLIIVEARAIRRRYRHWRVRRRYRKVAVVRIAAKSGSSGGSGFLTAVSSWEPGQIIPWNGERDSLPFGSIIPGPRRTANDYKVAQLRQQNIDRMRQAVALARDLVETDDDEAVSNATTDAERAWLAARPGGKR